MVVNQIDNAIAEQIDATLSEELQLHNKQPESEFSTQFCLQDSAHHETR